MNSSNVVSLHPYFKAHPGKLDAIQALLPVFVERTATEAGCIYYDFSLNGEEVFCREAYTGAEGILAHLSNVNEQLGEMLKLSDLIRLEVHGSAQELDKLREPLAGLNPAWFVLQVGVQR